MMGISFAYVPSMQAIAADFDIATFLERRLLVVFIALLVGLNIKRIRKFLPAAYYRYGSVFYWIIFVSDRDQLYGRRSQQ